MELVMDDHHGHEKCDRETWTSHTCERHVGAEVGNP